MSLPTLTGVARLVADPDIKFTASGKAVATVRLAFNSRKRDQNGDWVDGDTFFVRGTAWEQLAQNLADTCQKGTEVLVSGDLRTQSWEQDGQKREAPELTIRSIGPSLAYATARVERASRGSNTGAQGQSQQQAQRGRQAPAEDPWASGSRGGGWGSSGGQGGDSEVPF